jgi:hypothetical protein
MTLPDTDHRTRVASVRQAELRKAPGCRDKLTVNWAYSCFYGRCMVSFQSVKQMPTFTLIAPVEPLL